MSGKLILVGGGGVRAGKSAYAVARARALGARRAFVATARAYDEEMAERIRRHQAERAGDFALVEEPIAVAEAVERLAGFDVAVVDCLTLWLSNQLIDGVAAAEIERRATDLAGALRRAPCHLVVVTNEVGMGVHPETELGRIFRDLSGRAHQALARAADEVHLAVMGMLLRLKPGPVEAHFPGEPA